MTLSDTSKLPSVEKVCIGFCSDDVFVPLSGSPKFHSHDTIVRPDAGIDKSVKTASNGSTGNDVLKLAVGGDGPATGWMISVICSDPVILSRVVLLAL